MATTGIDSSRSAPSPGAERAVSVSQLNRTARELLERGFSDIWVRGEISRFLAHPSGHWYFTLKDDGASISAAMFRGANRACRLKPVDGMQVLVRGRVSLYEQRGTYQIIVESVEPDGEGALFLAFEKLKKRLAEEGLFDAARKRRLPLLPRRIGIATSPTGAALHDILRVLATRGARLHVVIAACRVQGDGAADEIVCALKRLDDHGGLDVVIVGRGGGSIEDLWAFNEEIVARAILAMRVPVISAVGHEIDTTISDLVADVRAATPSQAAELVAVSALEAKERLASLERRMAHAVQSRCHVERARLSRVDPVRVGARVAAHAQRLAQHVDHLETRLLRCVTEDLRRRRARVDGACARLSPQHVARVARGRRERLDARLERLVAAARRRIAEQREQARALGRALVALSPLAVLERGYSVLQREGGQVVRRSDEVIEGERLRARLAVGELRVEVGERIEPQEA